MATAGEDKNNSDHSADGIGVIDFAQKRMVKRLPSGSDPEQFAVSADGKRIYISNEDDEAASVMSVDDGKVLQTISVKEEPEGVAISPNGKKGKLRRRLKKRDAVAMGSAAASAAVRCALAPNTKAWGYKTRFGNIRASCETRGRVPLRPRRARSPSHQLH